MHQLTNCMNNNIREKEKRGEERGGRGGDRVGEERVVGKERLNR